MKLDLTELKILSGAILGSVIAPIDVLLRFLIPIASAATWYFLKPKLLDWQENRQKKRKSKLEK